MRSHFGIDNYLSTGIVCTHMCVIGLLNGALGALAGQLLAVVVVLALMAGAAFLSVRVLRPKLLHNPKNVRMKRLETLHLEPRRSLHLVRIDNREMVVGISEDSMQFYELVPPEDREERPSEHD